MAWDDEKVDRLKVMVIEGKSAREIAKALGCSRNAVIGIVHRRIGVGFLGAPKPQAKQIANRVAKEEAKKQAARPRSVRPPKQAHNVTPIKPAPVVDLAQFGPERREPCGCRFIHGDPAVLPWGYCQSRDLGKRTDGTPSAFCKQHHAICWHPAPQRKRAA